MGIRGFYTPTGYGTVVAEGKEVRGFRSSLCVGATRCDRTLPLSRPKKGIRTAILWFRETARNFSPLMAMAATTTIAEVEELVGLGDIPGEDVHLPGIFVQRIYQGSNYENAIEFPVYAAAERS